MKTYKFNGQDVVVVEYCNIEEGMTILATDYYGYAIILASEVEKYDGLELSGPDDGYDMEGGEEIGIHKAFCCDYSGKYVERICTLDWHVECEGIFNYCYEDGRNPYHGSKLEELISNMLGADSCCNIEDMKTLKAEYRPAYTYEGSVTFDEAFNNAFGCTLDEWIKNITNFESKFADLDLLTEEELERANDIFEQAMYCDDDESVDWRWLRKLKRERNWKEQREWAYDVVSNSASKTESDKVIAKAALLFLDNIND